MKHSWKRNSSASTLFIESHWYIPHFTLSSRQKLHFLTVKRSSSSYKQKILQIFPGKKPFLSPTFKYLTTITKRLSFPQTHDLLVSQTFHIPLSCLYAIMNHWVTDQFLGPRIYSSGFRLLLPWPSWRFPWFQLYSCQNGPSFSTPR